jgi:hypothetical protein
MSATSSIWPRSPSSTPKRSRKPQRERFGRCGHPDFGLRIAINRSCPSTRNPQSEIYFPERGIMTLLSRDARSSRSDIPRIHLLYRRSNFGRRRKRAAAVALSCRSEMYRLMSHPDRDGPWFRTNVKTDPASRTTRSRIGNGAVSQSIQELALRQYCGRACRNTKATALAKLSRYFNSTAIRFAH